MSKPIWIRLRSVLDRDADATSVELSRESAEEMLAEIKRLTAEVERLLSVTVVQETLIREAEAESEKLRAALEEIIQDSFSVYAIQVARAALSGDKQ